MGLFGPSKDEVWQRLAHEVGADFVGGGFWKGGKVQAHVGPWTITLDTHTVSTGHHHVTYTRMRAPYVNPDGFRFMVYRKGGLQRTRQAARDAGHRGGRPRLRRGVHRQG